MEKEKQLTAKQQRFVEEYLVDLNATQAAIRSGYSEKTAHDIGCENLKKPDIEKAIKERRDAISEQTLLTTAELDKNIRFMMEAAKVEPVYSENGERIGTKVHHGGLGKALDLYGKRLGAYSDKLIVDSTLEDIDEHDLDKAIKGLASEIAAQTSARRKT